MAVVGWISSREPVLDANVMTLSIRYVKIIATLMTLYIIKSNVYYNDVTLVIFSKIVNDCFSTI